MTDPSEPTLLDKIRGMWEFASTIQFLYLFFDMFGLEDVDVEVFEEELVGVKEPKLIPLIRLKLLQGLSGNRSISLENLDEFCRKQFMKRKPDANPFGDEENPTAWSELDVFAQIRVLRQLCTWQLENPERFRERADIKDSEQVDWRILPIGWDANDNSYYLLDDNRLYYREPLVIPEDPYPRKRLRGKKRKRGARRVVESDDESQTATNGVEYDEDATWHVQCITMDDFNDFLTKLKKSRDLNEKALYRHLNENVMPQLIEEEKERERQRQIREQEYLKEQAYAARKRSNRLVQREEDRKLMAEREAEMAKLQAEEEERRRELARIKKLEQEREARLQLREQRQRERELRIQQREEEKRKALEEAEQPGQQIKLILKMPESPASAKLTARQQALETQRPPSEPESKKEEESWFFDCLCGKHGTNYDDGGYTVACERCEIWQHVDCLPDATDRYELNLRKDAPEGTYPEYEFICNRCRKKAKEASKAEAIKTKEQLRKEREREINRAKYERRKAREKAKKEEERRKREEEERLGIVSTTPNGQMTESPSGEIRVQPHRPLLLDSPLQPPITSTQPYTTPPYPAHLSYPAPRPLSYPAQPPSMAHSSSLPQNGNNVSIGQYPESSQRPIPPFHHTLPPTPYPDRSPQPSLHSYASQQVSQNQSPQSQQIRPPIAPYWSLHTTNQPALNGHSFSPAHSHSPPYSNGVTSLQSQTTNIATSPPQNLQNNVSGQSNNLPPPIVQQHRPPQAPIQPRPSRSPEIKQLPSHGHSYPRQVWSPAPNEMAPSGQRVPAPIQPRPASLSQSPVAPLVLSNRSQVGAQPTPTSSHLPNQPSLPSVRVAEPQQSAESGERVEEKALDTVLKAGLVETLDKKGSDTTQQSSLILNGAVNDVVEQDGGGTGKLAKENQRTKMSFLLN